MAILVYMVGFVPIPVDPFHLIKRSIGTMLSSKCKAIGNLGYRMPGRFKQKVTIINFMLFTVVVLKVIKYSGLEHIPLALYKSNLKLSVYKSF